jgi:hypothetical protein
LLIDREMPEAVAGVLIVGSRGMHQELLEHKLIDREMPGSKAA